MGLTASDINQMVLRFLPRVGDSTVGGTIIPNATNTHNLGSAANRFDTIYARQIVADSLSGTGGSADTVDGFHAYSTPNASALLALDASSVFPTSVYPNALLRDGSRSLTGNLAVSAGVTIDGVDISAHAVDGTIHHTGGMSADDHSQYVHTSLSRTITASHQFAPGSAAAPFTLGVNAQGQTVTGFKADQLNKSVIAGSGLTGGGALTASVTLNVGAGNGITVNADDVAVNLKSTSGLEVDGTGLALADTVAGSGLTVASKVLSVGAGTLISVAADTVSLSNGSAQYQVPMTGATPFTPAWTNLSTLAGNGLVFSSGTFAVGAGTGITVNADDIQVKLKTLSGLEADSAGLAVQDAIAGNGLSITNKVLAVNVASPLAIVSDTVTLSGGTAQYQTLVTGAGPNYTGTWTDLNTMAGAGIAFNTGVFDIGAGNGIQVNADSIQVKLQSPSGLTADSSGLAIADTVAGAGLTIASKVLAVGAGALITVAADTVGVANGSAQWQVPVTGASPFTPAYTSLSSLAGDGLTFSTNFTVALSATSGLQLVGTSPNKTLEINDTVAGNGLTISSKVLAVGAGTLITVGSTAVSLSNGTAQYQVPVTGANPYTPAYTALSTFAGVGLNFTGGQFVLGTPSTLTAGTTNSSSGTTHSHAITASANPGAAEFILKTTPAGGLTLASAAITGALTVGQDLTVGTNVLFVDQSEGLVGINCVPDPQFQLDVNSNIRARGYIVGKHAIQLKDAKLIAHFDGPEPFETNFTGEATGHMGQVATLSGGYAFRPGKFQKGLQVAEATTNEITNPSFEYGANGASVTSDGWTLSQSGTGATATYDTSRAYIGSQSCKLVASTVSNSNVYRAVSVADGETITVQARVYRTGAVSSKLRIFDATNSVERATASTTATDTWEYLTCTWTNNLGSTVNAALMVTNSAADGTSAIWVDACQLERKAYSTPYCDGSMGSGHTWAGTAHLSASSRTNAVVSYSGVNNINLNAGTVSLWYYNDGTHKRGYARAFQYRIDANNYIGINVSSTTNNPYAIDMSGGVSVQTSSGATAAVVGWNYLVATWKTGGQFKLYLNGQLTGTTPSYTAPVGSGGTIAIGRDVTGVSQHLNDVIDDVVIVGRELTVDEIRAIYESDAPVFAESSTWAFKSASQIVWADEEGLWAIDTSGNPAFGVSGVDGKSWGGNTLDKGDILMGRSSNYLKWDASAGLISLYSPGSSLTKEEYFDGTTEEVNNRWTPYLGSTSLLSVTSGGYAGGNVLRIGDNSGNDECRIISNQSIPFDPNKLYRVFFRVRLVASSSPGTVYLGVAGRNATDTAWVNVTGSDVNTSQHYFAASNQVLTAVGEGGAWSEFTGYFRGVNTTGNGGVHALASAPGTLHESSRYFRLFLWVNWLAKPGIVEVDEIRVDIMPNYSDSPFAHSSDTTTIDGGKIFTGSITADKITTATLSAIVADLGTVTAGSIVVGTTNKLWLNDAADGALAIGGTVKGSAPFRVTAAGVLTATSGTIGGWSITSTQINSSGITMIADATAASNKIYVGTGTYNSSDTAFYVDGSGRFSLKNKLVWDGSSLTIDGGVTATTGSIGGWTIATNTLSATNILLDSNSKYFRIGATPASMTFGSTDGVQIEYNGGDPRVYFGNGTNRYFSFDGTNISWQGASTSLTTGGLFTANNASITGAITANSGSIAGSFTVGANLSVSTSGSFSSGATAYNTGTGWWMEYNAGTPRFFLGNAAGNKLTWNGSSLDITGNITANGTGQIGGWTIASTGLSSGGINLVSSGTAVNNKIYVGTGNYANGDTAFLVDGSGRMSLKDKLVWDGTKLSVSGAVVLGAGVGFTVSNPNLHLPFDGPAPYETDYQVTLTGHLGQRPVSTSGGLIGRPGKYGKGLQVAEATTNELTNPSFEAGNVGDAVTSYGWSYSQTGTGGTATNDNLRAYVGVRSCKILASSTGVSSIYKTVSVTNGDTITVQARVWRGSAIATRLRVYDHTNNTTRVTTNAAETNTWELLTATWTNNTGGTVNASIMVTNDGADSASMIWVDACQVERKTRPTPYCDGSLGAGHSWSGTAHASTSSRTAAAVSYNNSNIIDSTPGTFAAWVYMYGYPVSGETSYLFDSRDISNTNSPSLLIGASGGVVWQYNGASVISTAASSVGVRAWYHVAVTYDYTSGSQVLYVNGTQIGTSSSTTPPSNFGAKLFIGSRYTSVFMLNGVIDDAVFVDRVLSADEVYALYNSGQAIQATTSPFQLMLTGSGLGKVWGDSSGLFGQTSSGTASFALVNENGISWAGGTLDAGDVMIGTSTTYLKWDTSLAELEVKGKISATSGSITNTLSVLGTLDVGSSGVIKSGATGYDSGTGWWLDYNAGSPRFFIGNSAGNKLTYSAGTLSLSGTVSAATITGDAAVTTGKITAASGAVRLDSNGVSVNMAGLTNGVRWYTSSAFSTQAGEIYVSSDTSGEPMIDLRTGSSPTTGVKINGNYSGIRAPNVYVDNAGAGGGGYFIGSTAGGFSRGNLFIPIVPGNTSTSFDGDAFSTTSATNYTVNTYFSSVPNIAKAILVRVSCRDSGSASNNSLYVALGTSDDTTNYPLIVRPAGLPNDYFAEGQGIVPLNSSGQFRFQCVASGTGTLDVYIQVWGYFL